MTSINVLYVFYFDVYFRIVFFLFVVNVALLLLLLLDERLAEQLIDVNRQKLSRSFADQTKLAKLGLIAELVR